MNWLTAVIFSQQSETEWCSNVCADGNPCGGAHAGALKVGIVVVRC